MKPWKSRSIIRWDGFPSQNQPTGSARQTKIHIQITHSMLDGRNIPRKAGEGGVDQLQYLGRDGYILLDYSGNIPHR
jgi:hypothetical protein